MALGDTVSYTNVPTYPKDTVYEVPPWLTNQVPNRNFLSPVGFKLVLGKKRRIDYYSNKAGIPSLNLPPINVNTPLKSLPMSGTNMGFGDFSFEFLVDEDMTNYMALWNWMVGLGYPDSISQLYNLQLEYPEALEPSIPYENILAEFSSGFMHILNSQFRPIVEISFQNLQPISLEALPFDATADDIQYLTARTTFTYDYYTIKPLDPSCV